MAQQITIDIVAQTKDFTSDINATISKVQKLTTAFVGIGVAAKGFSTAGRFINKATDAASDMNETVSKINVLFGKSSKEVLNFAKSAATSFGQSKQQALDASATFATFGKAAGLAGKDLVKFSTDFVGLASDLASFNNTSPEQAINAIGSALRGEAEPLRQYGVLLNDATLKQAALELGIISNTKNALTPQQKVLAAQKVIYEQTTAAQGDFARTSDGLANSTRILEAKQADLNANLGQTFLPIMQQVNSIMQVAVDAFGALPDPVQKIVVGVGLLVATVGPFIILIGSLKTALAALQISMISLSTVMAALPWVAVIAGIVLLIKNFDDVSAAAKKVWEAISKWWGQIYDDIKDFAGKAIDWLKENWPKILAVLTGPFGLFTLFLVKHKDEVIEKVTELWNKVKEIASTIATAYKDAVIAIFTALKEKITENIASIAAIAEIIWTTIKDKAIEIVSSILINLGELWDAIATLVVKIVTGMKDSIVAVWNKLKDTTTNVFNGIKEKASEIWDNIKDYIIGVVRNVLDKFSTVRSQMIEVGKDIARGIIDGLLNIRGWFVDKLTKWVNDNIPAVIRKILQISSPSKVMMRVGENITEGLYMGMGLPGAPGINLPSINVGTGAAAPVVININAAPGTDLYSLGRTVNNAVNKYSRISNQYGVKQKL